MEGRQSFIKLTNKILILIGYYSIVGFASKSKVFKIAERNGLSNDVGGSLKILDSLVSILFHIYSFENFHLPIGLELGTSKAFMN